MLKATLIASLFLLFNCVETLAQSDFRPGYVVRPEGDTLRGLVDYQSAQRSAVGCRFRTDAAQAVQEFVPGTALGYGFVGASRYEARLTPLAEVAAPSLPAQLQFVEIIVHGPISLYARRDLQRHDHYYIRGAGATSSTEPLQELRRLNETIINAKGQKFERYNNEYVAVLAQAFKSCPQEQLRVNQVQFGLRFFVDAVTRYNACVNTTPDSLLPQNPTLASRSGRLHLEVLAGVHRSTLRVDNDQLSLNGPYKSGFSPVLGLAAGYNLSKISKKLSFRLEALYDRQAYDGVYTYQSRSTNNTFREEARLRLQYIRIPVLFRYSLPKGAVRPFVQVGISGAFALQRQVESRNILVDFGSNPQFSVWKPALETRKIEQGFVAGIGASAGRLAGRSFGAEFRAEITNGFSAIVSSGTTVKRFSALLSYDLTK
ncbi:porin family protein [Hymenobacter sp. IS2118]|uniref:porin family protein n=1 Tax=Hymenobacter sp. IS2118 TaxID=1505605 RepID=UPI0005596067|nr:porin family protein [Hymenobacter sp. IS2118]